MRFWNLEKDRVLNPETKGLGPSNRLPVATVLLKYKKYNNNNVLG